MASTAPVAFETLVGGMKMASAYADTMGAALALVAKKRKTATTVEAMNVVGEVAGCDAKLPAAMYEYVLHERGLTKGDRTKRVFTPPEGYVKLETKLAAWTARASIYTQLIDGDSVRLVVPPLAADADVEHMRLYYEKIEKEREMWFRA